MFTLARIRQNHDHGAIITTIIDYCFPQENWRKKLKRSVRRNFRRFQSKIDMEVSASFALIKIFCVNFLPSEVKKNIQKIKIKSFAKIILLSPKIIVIDALECAKMNI